LPNQIDPEHIKPLKKLVQKTKKINFEFS